MNIVIYTKVKQKGESKPQEESNNTQRKAKYTSVMIAYLSNSTMLLSSVICWQAKYTIVMTYAA